MLKQQAVYWGPPVDDGDGGFTFPQPQFIACRWEDVKGEVDDPKSHEVMTRSTVYVDRDVVVDGYLYLWEPEESGALSESDLAGTIPDSLEGAKKIKGFQKMPNLKGTKFLRVANV